MNQEKYTVKQARRLAGKSQDIMATKLGVCLSTYRKLEENSEQMTMLQARTFCNEVDIPMNRIIFGHNSI